MRKIKKIIGYCLLLFGCFCLISCDSKKEGIDLTCSKDLTNENGLSTNMSTIVNYDGDTINTVTLKWFVTYDPNEYTQDEIEELVLSTESTYKKTYGNNNNIRITSSKFEENKYLVSIVIDYQKLSDNDKKAYGFDFPDGLEKSKKDFEDAGYTCK